MFLGDNLHICLDVQYVGPMAGVNMLRKPEFNMSKVLAITNTAQDPTDGTHSLTSIHPINSVYFCSFVKIIYPKTGCKRKAVPPEWILNYIPIND